MNNKLGNYISNLMTVILDSNQDQFIKDLALSELKNLSVDVEQFLRKHIKDDSEEIKKTEKQLLQEEKNVKNK
tara:strand:+ start:536 stop:754 length:219 start_codon:yes stop_codon:yes gene_type:complete